MSTPTRNRDVYTKDPSERKLENEGVANVNDERTAQQLHVLKYELDTFVCSGQYADGLERILTSFLANISKAEQPAVWVSGFYGSGKSHLVKMLRALWVNQAFDDGQRARDIATLPTEVTDRLHELDVAAKRLGGSHAASGTLGAGSDTSVRLALLGIVFKSAGLPEDYSAAMLVLWLRREGKLDEVTAALAAEGRTLERELRELYMSVPLHRALVGSFPEMYADVAACGDRLTTQFRPKDDVTSHELVDAIRRTLAPEGQDIPLTLVVLDEVQQYIGQSDERSIAVQEALEAISKRFAGRLLFIATGQAALAGTAKINKLEGRFPVRVQLRDEDVDEVVRKVVLDKKPSAVPALEQVRDRNIGELSKHLTGTQLGRQPRDAADFPRDYPILPARRRFWEHALRALDTTSVKSQLRNQLGVVHRVIQANLDAPLGHVVPADALFFDAAPSLLQDRVLPRRVYDFALNDERSADSDKRLAARAVGIVYLINQIKKDQASVSLGLKADVSTVADLLVTDLDAGSASLRARLPALLDACDLLDKIDEEYVIQTEESARWRDRYLNESGRLSGDALQLESERDERIRRMLGKELSGIKLQQGAGNVPRTVALSTAAAAPPADDGRVTVWVPGLAYAEDDLALAAREAGAQSPTIFVHLPLGSKDDLRKALVEYKAADITISKEVASNTAEGTDALNNMETIRKSADQKIEAIIAETIRKARVYQGGGTEVLGTGLRSLVEDAAAKSLLRLYPKFGDGDHANWGRVYEQARRGSPDAFQNVGHAGELKEHPVVKRILEYVGSGKTGKEIHAAFEGSPYGWSADAVDGTLFALLQAGFVNAKDQRGKTVKLADLTKSDVAKTDFSTESVVLRASDKIAARGILGVLVPSVQTGAELGALDEFYRALDTLAASTGGEPPLPTRQRLPPALQDVASMGTSNERLVETARHAEALRTLITEWQALRDLISRRQPTYQELSRLLTHVAQLPDSEAKADVLREADALRQNRLLLDDADPAAGLTKEAGTLLRDRLIALERNYHEAHARGMSAWTSSPHYASLTPAQRNELLAAQMLTAAQQPNFAHGNTAEIIATLGANNLEQLATRVEVLPTRFDKLLENAKRMAAPEAPVATKVYLVRRDLKTEADVEAWLMEAGAQLRAKLAEGVVVRPD